MFKNLINIPIRIDSNYFLFLSEQLMLKKSALAVTIEDIERGTSSQSDQTVVVE